MHNTHSENPEAGELPGPSLDELAAPVASGALRDVVDAPTGRAHAATIRVEP